MLFALTLASKNGLSGPFVVANLAYANDSSGTPGQAVEVPEEDIEDRDRGLADPLMGTSP